MNTFALDYCLWVAVAVTGLAAFCARSLGIDPFTEGLPALFVVFFSTLTIYNLDGLIDTRGAGQGVANQRVVTLASAGLALFSACRLFPVAAGVSIIGAACCSLYALPWNSRSTNGIKALPYLKAPFVGTAVAVAVVWVPLLGAGRPPSPAAIVLTVTMAAATTTNALLFDIPDRDEDRKTQTPTLPVRWGVEATRQAGLQLCAAGLVSAIAAMSWMLLPFSSAIGLLALHAYMTIACLRTGANSSAARVAWWVDGGLLVPSLVASVARFHGG